MRNVRTCANSVDRLGPNLCLKETMVNTDKNQIKATNIVTRFVTVRQNNTSKNLGNPLVLDL